MNDPKGPQSGYADCACRDCFDVAIAPDCSYPSALCGECEDAGCEAYPLYDDADAVLDQPSHAYDCRRDDAYGCDEPDTFYASEASSFDAACALYWYAADHHGGQWSDLYALLSRSPYSPGPMEHGPRDEAAIAIYQLLASGVLDPWDLELWIDAKYDADTDGDR